MKTKIGIKIGEDVAAILEREGRTHQECSTELCGNCKKPTRTEIIEAAVRNWSEDQKNGDRELWKEAGRLADLAFCRECDQPMLPPGKQREKATDYRHANGCSRAKEEETNSIGPE